MRGNETQPNMSYIVHQVVGQIFYEVVQPLNCSLKLVLIYIFQVSKY